MLEFLNCKAKAAQPAVQWRLSPELALLPANNMNGQNDGLDTPANALGERPRRCTVLLVEDDEVLRSVLRDAIQEKGYLVEEAGDGASGLLAVLKHNPCFIITDIMMPVMDGIDFIMAVRKIPAATMPILAISATTDPGARQAAIASGATWFFIKPFSPEPLLEMIATARLCHH